MTYWQRWARAPQTLGFRRALFQIHLWMGIGFGFYVLGIGISGSAILLKSPFYGWFEPSTVEPSADAVALEGDALNTRMADVYAGYEIGFTFPSYDRIRATYVVLEKDNGYFPHYFNQFTGEDLGAANPWPIKTVEWIADVHDDLLLGPTGRTINGLGGLLFILMSLSGIVLWWQGRSRWHEGLLIKRHSNRKLIWQLHSFIGFWSLLLMFAWGVSGLQLSFPQYFNALLDWFDNDLNDVERPDSVLRFFRSIHFARPGEGEWARRGWILVSFVPTIMLVSGLVLWWRRVLVPLTSRGLGALSKQ